jgi:hypothetical protein
MQSQSSKVSEKISPKHTKRILNNQQHSSDDSSRPQNQKEKGEREKKEKLTN